MPKRTIEARSTRRTSRIPTKSSNVKNRPIASSPEVRRRMLATRRRNTPSELLLRSFLHSMGYRFRTDRQIAETRYRPDVVFSKAKVAVFVDGCFWHGCPIHATWPKTNAAWWRNKIESNRRRDLESSKLLRANGWMVLRFWTHANMQLAARRVAKVLERRRTKQSIERL